MKLYFLIAAIFGSLFSNAQLSEKTIDSIISIYAGNGEFNGSVYISKDGAPAYFKNFGYKNVSKKESFSGDEVFQIGSVTKQFTAAVILKLQEEGKLSLEDKITKYFPQYPSWDSIKIHHLLNHTGGVFNYTNISKFMTEEVHNPKTRKEMIDLFSGRKLMFSPGSNFVYSNSGYLLLGYIIEDVSGMSYDKAVRKYIFNPLEMNNSGFDFAGLPENVKATGYAYLKNDSAIATVIVDSTVSGAAGNIYSTAEDLNKWVQGLLNGKVISKESFKKMTTPVLGNYGYGIIADSLHGNFTLLHGGGIHGFNAQLEFFPDVKIAVVLLSNVNSGKLQEIADLLSAHALGLPLPKEYQPEPGSMKKLEGKYEITKGFEIDVTVVEGKLTVQATNQSRFNLVALSDTNYVLKIINARINFSLNDSGEAEKLELIQSGQKFTGIKIKE